MATNHKYKKTPLKEDVNIASVVLLLCIFLNIKMLNLRKILI